MSLPQALSNMCTYIGGISRNLDISEVVNNNLAAEGNTAVIAGKGVGASLISCSYTLPKALPPPPDLSLIAS